jgi:hypothetical protein
MAIYSVSRNGIIASRTWKHSSYLDHHSCMADKGEQVMNPSLKVQLCCLLVLVIALLPEVAHSQESDTAASSKVDTKDDTDLLDREQVADQGAEGNPVKLVAWNTEKLELGEAAFQKSCIDCHDANRSLDKKKSLKGWHATVQRMADKDGADVSAQDVDCISMYLTSRHQPNPEASKGESVSATDEDDPLSIFGTVSPSWRGGNADLQNPGFLPDAWLGAAWKSSSSPISGRVTACISCHTEPGLGSRIELVEAVVRLDLTKWLNRGCDSCERDTQVAVEAGRIVVPFGAFSSQVNPGVYRTVSKPLIYNMGQRVFDDSLGDPVLPMPYSDEGANLSVSKQVFNDVVATGDFYIVNGLQGGGDGIDFDASRDYVDNNKTPAIGGRFTIGNSALKLGASMMSGRYNDNSGSGPNGRGLDYWIYGADATYRYEDILRIQIEYAQRDTDRYVNLAHQLFSRDRVGGCYVEGELLVSRKYKLSLLNRYDIQSRHSVVPLGGDVPGGSFDVSRYTYGLNHVLPGGSLLMFNVEHWFLPKPLKDIDVLGVRWAATF